MVKGYNYQTARLGCELKYRNDYSSLVIGNRAEEIIQTQFKRKRNYGKIDINPFEQLCKLKKFELSSANSIYYLITESHMSFASEAILLFG